MPDKQCIVQWLVPGPWPLSLHHTHLTMISPVFAMAIVGDVKNPSPGLIRLSAASKASSPVPAVATATLRAFNAHLHIGIHETDQSTDP